jgi:hypothetical protein
VPAAARRGARAPSLATAAAFRARAAAVGAAVGAVGAGETT